VTRGVTFLNVRLGSAMIAIDKVGPASATAGDTLRYQLFVTNPGYVSFPAAPVEVVDPNCDEEEPSRRWSTAVTRRKPQASPASSQRRSLRMAMPAPPATISTEAQAASTRSGIGIERASFVSTLSACSIGP
jgi:hypothetical protein